MSTAFAEMSWPALVRSNVGVAFPPAEVAGAKKCWPKVGRPDTVCWRKARFCVASGHCSISSGSPTSTLLMLALGGGYARIDEASNRVAKAVLALGVADEFAQV